MANNNSIFKNSANSGKLWKLKELWFNCRKIFLRNFLLLFLL